MSDGTIPTPGASVGAEVVLESTGDTVTAAEAAVVEVRVTNPPAVPYRTGSYLIYDEGGTDQLDFDESCASSANTLSDRTSRALSTSLTCARRHTGSSTV